MQRAGRAAGGEFVVALEGIVLVGDQQHVGRALERAGALERGAQQGAAIGQAQERLWIERARHRPEPAAGAARENDRKDRHVGRAPLD